MSMLNSKKITSLLGPLSSSWLAITVYLRDISNITFRTEFDNAVNIRSDSELVIFNCNNVANFVIQESHGVFLLAM